jgi:hypothetical protein
MGFPTIGELEIAFLTGKDIAIIVEGESYEDDPWFYGQWFNDLEVVFHPQNGWPRVIEAVTELRRRCPNVPIYGIIDRDFTDDTTLDAEFAELGILRTPRYTLENYLLEPECWAEVFSIIFRRTGGAPDGWDDPAQVQIYIEQSYHNYLTLAAHDQVIAYGNHQYSEQAKQTSEDDRRYLKHPDQLEGKNPAEKLRAWGQQLNANEDLGDLFEEHLKALEEGDLLAWQCHVSGKHVLQELHRHFPDPPRTGQFKLYHYQNEYLRVCPDPPPDLATLVGRIIEHARS